jgi:hypothetical protein
MLDFVRTHARPALVPKRHTPPAYVCPGCARLRRHCCVSLVGESHVAECRWFGTEWTA